VSWDDFKNKPQNSDAKDVTFRSSGTGHFYAIFRIGKKFKEVDGKQNGGLNAIKHFEKHMERKIEVQNADTKIENEILIGSQNIYGDVKEYIKDVKLRKNSVIARELLMTASPDFFKGMMKQDLEKWKTENMKWLRENFGSNLIYVTCHRDEKSPHIHALIVPKFKNKKGENILSNTRYFDGIEKMREWQSNYAKSMQTNFKSLNRGIMYSKAKHMTLKQYYTLVNKELDTKDLSQVIIKAKNSELLEIKIKSIQKTLEVYKNYNSKNELQKDRAIQESKELVNEITKLKDNKEVYHEALSLLSQQYKIPQYAVKEAIRICENINDKEK
jgi:hypothetical protein